MMTKNSLIAAVALGGLLCLDASSAFAEEGRRTNNLANDVAVRHRRLLVKNRFELAPLFESTINADFRHILGAGAKLEYHLSDMFSIGVIGVYSTAVNTKLIDRIMPTLEDSVDNNTREPSKEEFESRLNSMPLHGAAYVSLTPWYGKLAAFGQSFVAFDFYFPAGVAFAQLKSNCPSNICNDPAPGMSTEGPGGDTRPPDMNPNNDAPLNSGGRAGLYIGGGVHVFLNDFIALDLTVRDYAFTDNPSGADF
ncbi:MAG: outer membrane beta-barrel domain-containing protein, partial [Kofleriaceae bacterium]